VLRLGDGDEEVLAYFRGEGQPTVEFETSESTSTCAADDDGETAESDG